MQIINIKTARQSELIDITDRIKNIVSKTKTKDGICYVFVPHTTAGITINENADPSVRKDIISRLRPPMKQWRTSGDVTGWASYFCWRDNPNEYAEIIAREFQHGLRVGVNIGTTGLPVGCSYALDKIVPQDDNYTHAEGNSAAHIKASLMGSAVNIIVEGGSLALGTWQGIYFAEFDGPRAREVWVSTIRNQ